MDRAIVDLAVFFAVQRFVPLTDAAVLQAVRAAFLVASALWWWALQDLPARVQQRAAALPAAHRERRRCWLPQAKKPAGFMEALMPPPPPAAPEPGAPAADPDAPQAGVEYLPSTIAAHEEALAVKLRDGALMAAAQPIIFSVAMNVHVMVAVALLKFPLTVLREPLVVKHLLAPLCAQLLGFVPGFLLAAMPSTPGGREYGELLVEPPPPPAAAAEGADAAALAAGGAADKPAAPGAADAAAALDDGGGVPGEAAAGGAGPSSALRLRKGAGKASAAAARVFNLESEEAVFGTWESHVTDTDFVGVFESLQATAPPHDINYQTVQDAWSALMVVCGSVQYREHDVRRLLKAGARPELADADGWTALHWAAHHGCAFAVLAVCASLGAPGGKTAAVEPARPAALAALLAAKDAKGRSAEQVARERGNEAEARALKEAAEWAAREQEESR